MRKFYFLFLAMIAICFSSSCDKETGIQAEVIRDCTGTYLRVDNKDYWVFNFKKTDSFASGAMVVAVFEKTSNCKSDFSSCYMLHENEGWIDIKHVKKL